MRIANLGQGVEGSHYSFKVIGESSTYFLIGLYAMLDGEELTPSFHHRLVRAASSPWVSDLILAPQGITLKAMQLRDKLDYLLQYECTRRAGVQSQKKKKKTTFF